jgi:hypothetical protein
MTLSAGTGFNAIAREIFGFANQVNFADGSTGDDRVVFDFTSPSQLYLVEMMPAINTNGMSPGDILSFSLTGNNLPLFQTKFALSVSNEPVQAQLPSIKFILPKLTILKAIFNMQSGTVMVGTATCMFRGVQFG